MTEIISPLKNNTKDIKLFSSRAISGATFLGGPLAAGYLINKNFKALNKPVEARITLIIGIITTILLFVGLFLLPEKLIESIPRQLIPIIYTGIIWGIVEWKQGDILKIHKENNNSFFSGWRAAGIGFISLLIIGIGILGYALLSIDNDLNEKYDADLAQFSINENESLVFYDHLNSKTNYSLLQELDEQVIPNWKQNVDIINRINTIEDLPLELVEQNEILLNYSELRIQAFKLFRKAIKEDTDKYDQQLEEIHLKIDKELKKLN